MYLDSLEQTLLHSRNDKVVQVIKLGSSAFEYLDGCQQCARISAEFALKFDLMLHYLEVLARRDDKSNLLRL